MKCNTEDLWSCRAPFVTAGKLRTELMSLMSHHRVTYPTLKALQELGVATYTWEVYKRMESSKPNDLLEDRQRILGIKYDKCVFSEDRIL